MADLLLEKEFAGYRVDRRVGRGGMGVVYQATDLALDRTVALKVLAEELAEDAVFRRRFIGECKIAASLDHPNIVPIYAAGEHDGRLYLAMRFVFGDDLRTVLLVEGARRRRSSTVTAAPGTWMPLSEGQRRVLVALCRPLGGSAYATPATNRAIADEVHLSVDAVKAHLRVLFERFGLADLPQNEKRARLAAVALVHGVVHRHDL
jgi:hypothetical protein